MQTCSECGELKPFVDYYKKGDRGGYFKQCKACVLIARRVRYEQDGETLRARVERYRKANAEIILARQRAKRAADPEGATRQSRAAQLKKYGMTPDDFEAMFETQGRCCAICGSDYPGRFWAVDHDHTMGPTAVRGILCWHCNVGLGHFRDDVASLLAAVDYVLGVREQMDARWPAA